LATAGAFLIAVVAICILQPELIVAVAAALADYGGVIAAGIGIGGIAAEEELQEAGTID